jgi:hypothetical protein
MDEQYQAEQERENLSGADDYEAWILSMENENALIKTDCKPDAC